MEELEITCPLCGKTTTIEMTKEEYDEMSLPRSVRRPVQTIFPDMPKDLREVLISGYCPECQKMIFGEGNF